MYPLQDGKTPLHLAARGGHTSCIDCLLSTPVIDVTITAVSWSTRTCVHSNFHVDLTPRALQCGNSLLHLAAKMGLTTCVERHLSTPGIDVDAAFKTVFN